MGGYGSTRWAWYSKRLAVEDCRKLPIKIMHSKLLQGWRMGSVNWSRGGESTGSISYRVTGMDDPEAVRLIYTIHKDDPEKRRDYDYPVRLSTSPLPWGRHRFWFICPAMGCGRRVSVLYLPPRGEYFACRHCYRLSYRSRQEGYQDRAAFGHMARLMQDKLPGVTWQDMKEIFRR